MSLAIVEIVLRLLGVQSRAMLDLMLLADLYRW